jgi:hypothetical protein
MSLFFFSYFCIVKTNKLFVQSNEMLILIFYIATKRCCASTSVRENRGAFQKKDRQ